MTSSAPAVPRRLLAAAGVLVAIPVLTVGALLAALSERVGPRGAGLVLLAAGVATAVAGLAALRSGPDPRRPLLAAAAALLAAGIVAVVLLLTSGAVFLIDLLVVGGVPVAGALVLALLTRLAAPQAEAGRPAGRQPRR